MTPFADKFDVVIDGVPHTDLRAVPARFAPLVRSAIADAETRRASELETLEPGRRLRIEIDSNDANFSVAADFSISWNGDRYANYGDLPIEARDALLADPTFPDLDNDGVPDFFQHEISDDPAVQRETFREAMRQNRDAQAVVAAKEETFVPDFPGYALATFNFTIDGQQYGSLAEVPQATRQTAQLLIVEFLRRRAENGGEPLTDASVIRLSDGGVARPEVPATPPAKQPPTVMPADMANKVAEISSRNAKVKAEFAALAVSPVEESNAGQVAVRVMMFLGLVAVALIVAIIVVLVSA